MKTPTDPDDPNPLLDAVLEDHEWRRAQSDIKAEALTEFRRARQRARFTPLGLAAGLVLLAAMTTFHFLRPPADQTDVAPGWRPFSGESAPSLTTLTDAELINAFPQGSCVIADIDGETQLVFLDPEDESRYLRR